MIHHIKNYRLIIIVLFALLNLSCKNEVANSKTLSIDSTKTIQKIKSIEKIADTSKIKLNVNAINWIFNKVTVNSKIAVGYRRNIYTSACVIRKAKSFKPVAFNKYIGCIHFNTTIASIKTVVRKNKITVYTA